MNFLIYGAGALGQALGCMLAQAGNQVDFLIRSRYAGPIASGGLKVDGVLGEYSAPPENIRLLDSLDSVTSRYDYVLLTTKAYDTGSAAKEIAALGDQFNYVVSMQNGCGNIELLDDMCGKDKCLGARVITGFEITSPGRVHVSVTADAIHVGVSQGGAVTSAAEELANRITTAGHPCLVVDDIHASLFAKLLYNCALNPLGAILGVHYGVLAEYRETRRIMNRIINETFSVIEAMGGKTPWQSSEEYRKVFYDTLIPATYNHRASMLQDIEQGKPTEVEALVGYVSSMGKEFGVDTDTCDMTADMVRFKQAESMKKGVEKIL